MGGPGYLPTLGSERRGDQELVAFSVGGEAQTQGDLRASRFGKLYHSNPKLESWRTLVGHEARLAMAGRPLLAGPLRLSVRFILPRPGYHFGTGRNAGQLKERFRHAYPDKQPDLDKLVRAIKDALTKIVWNDDGQVSRLGAQKDYAPEGEGAGVQVVVEPMPFRAGAGSVNRVTRLRSGIGEFSTIDPGEQLRAVIRYLEPEFSPGRTCRCGRDLDPLVRWCACGLPTFSTYADEPDRRAARVLPDPENPQRAGIE